MFEAVYQIYEDTDFNSKYRLKKYLGSGSYGLVFLADEVIADRWMRQVALKIFRSDRAPADSILRELQLVCSFNHDYILRCFAPEQGSLQSPKGQTEECFALVMEVASTSLDRYLENQTLSPSEVTEIVRGMAKALIYLQEQNFVHRDIKPENILQVEGRWKLGDFGIARLLNNATVTNTKPLGTRFYMPPEALQGDGIAAVSFAWDVWSLGVMMTVMLSGQRPFPSNTINGLIQQVLNEEPSLPTLPHPYDEIIRGCLIKNRKQRWTAQQVLEALEAQGSPSFQRNSNHQSHIREGRLPQTYSNTIPVQQLSVSSSSQSLRIITSKVNRRRVLQWTGFLAVGIGAAIVTRSLFSSGTSQTTPIPESSLDSSEPKPPSKSETSLDSSEPKLSDFEFEIVTVNSRGEINQRRSGKAEQMIEDLGNGIKLEMVAIPRGSFIMGSPETELGSDDRERPQHEVKISPFLMAKYPVTQSQYQAIMGENPSDFSGANNPVERVNWYQAKEFCKRLSEKTGREYRLPSEAEWEYACRAGTTTPFYFGETITTDLANYNGNYNYRNAPKGKYRQQTTPVGSFPPNTFGLYDMHGNVYEWCEGVWRENYEKVRISESSSLSQQNNKRHVMRGGSWYSNPNYCRCAFRFRSYATSFNDNLGFRVVSSVLGTF